MALVDYVDMAEIDGMRVRADKDNEQRPSLFLRALANNPRVLDAHREFHDATMYHGDVDRRLKEIAHVTVSYTNECDYCASAHTERLLDTLDLPEGAIAAIASGDFSGVGETTEAVVRFAAQVADDPKRVGERHVEALRDAGFTDADVVELLEQCAEAMASNVIVDTLNIHAADYDDVEGDFDIARYHPDNYR